MTAIQCRNAQELSVVEGKEIQSARVLSLSDHKRVTYVYFFQYCTLNCESWNPVTMLFSHFHIYIKILLDRETLLNG